MELVSSSHIPPSIFSSSSFFSVEFIYEELPKGPAIPPPTVLSVLQGYLPCDAAEVTITPYGY